MTGKSHMDPSNIEFSKAIMQHMNDKCAEWRAAENISYSLYGTPMESTTYKFAKCLKSRFGIIPGVTDHNYITNSYHLLNSGLTQRCVMIKTGEPRILGCVRSAC